MPGEVLEVFLKRMKAWEVCGSQGHGHGQGLQPLHHQQQGSSASSSRTELGEEH